MKILRVASPFVFALLFLAILAGAGKTPAATQELQAADSTPNFEDEVVVVRAYFNDPQMVADLASWKEPWEVDYQKGYLVVDVDKTEYMLLESAGFRLEIDEALTAQLNEPHFMLPGQLSGIPGYPCYRTVEETYMSAEDIVATFPDLATWTDIGDSWEKTQGLGGYDLNVLKLTNSAIPGPKPKMFVMAAIHAREYTTAELVTRFAEYLVNNYNIDPDVTWLLDYHEIHLLLQSNPDGRKKAETGLFWRKNTNQNYCSPTSNDRGADLNRNFQFQWGCCGGSSSFQCDETYRGPSPASEPETQAVQNYIFANYPDLRDPGITASAPLTTTGLFFDIHASGELVLWPWGFTGTVPGNGTQMQTLGRKLAYFNEHWPEQAIGLYPTDGTTDDFAYGELGVPAFTFELGTSFFQSCGFFEGDILPKNMDALLYAAKVARQGYVLPAGPEALDPALAIQAVASGDPVTLTVTLNDTRYNNSNGSEPVQAIAAGEFYIDVPYWITDTVPVAFPLSPVDGTFNSSVEDAVGVIDTTGLVDGRHTIFIRGQDADGNWGAISAVFLFVINPDIAPTIQGEVRAADTNQPLTATISAGSFFQTSTDPLSGMYQMQVISGTYDISAVPGSPVYAASTAEGVVAHDYQTVQQDFLLYPYCPLFEDDVESGNMGWTPQPPWAITTENSHSPTHSWTDSPGVNYGNNVNVSLTSPVIDLTGYSGIQLNYWQICSTETGYDYCHVEVSSDGGTTWTEVASFDGPHFTWEQVSVLVPALDDQPQAQVRFRLESDVSITNDGWHVDDIQLLGAGAGCVDYTAPLAGFTSTSPDALGETTTFTNTSTGTDLSYAWNFGDGSPVVTDTHPVHTYTAIGSYTAIMTATNDLGSDVTAGTVEILLAPLAGFTSSSPDNLGETTVFTNTSTGTSLTYAWDFGDGSPLVTEVNPTHTYTASGPYTVTLTAINGVGSDVATGMVEIIGPNLDQYLFIPIARRE